MAGPSLLAGFDLPFQDQIDFFRAKLNLPTEVWDDIWQAAHDRSFVVAGAMKADLLDDLRQAVDKAISTGTSLETFRKDFREIVGKRGWQGWTGEGTPGGFAWRTKIIYETNLRTSYAAGRWAQLNDPALQKLMPYWRYIHSERVTTPRPLHKRWGDMRLTLPAGHAFWKTHFPPNGWGCRCRVTAVPKPKPGDATEPPEGWANIDEKTGAPIGIDKGWAYAPGGNVRAPLRDLVEQKLIKLDSKIGAAMWAQLGPAIAGETAENFSRWVDGVLEEGVTRHTYGIAGAMSISEINFYADRTGITPVTAEIAIEDRLIVGRKAARHEAAGNALTPEEWKTLPEALAGSREVYFDKIDNKLLYVVPSLTDARVMKLAVQVDFALDHPKRTLNVARAGFKISTNALRDTTRYERVE